MVPFICSFCGRHGEIEASKDCTGETLELLKKMLACQPCSATMPDRRWLQKKFVDILKPLILGTKMDCEDRQAVWETLLEQTRKYAAFICALHKSQAVWDDALPEALFQTPERWLEILKTYEAAVRKNPAQPEML